MNTYSFLLRHGYAVLFVWVLAEQVGLPLPAVPILLTAGSLAGAGRLSLGDAIALAVVASLVADILWYEMGRRRGARVLTFLCRLSFEPDSCVRRTEEVFARHGAQSLLAAKFVAGLNTAAPPLAGIFRMRFSSFLFYDGLGALLWAASFVGLGWLFSDQLELLASQALRLGRWLLVLLLGSLASYLAIKYLHRRRFLRELRIARITPEELQQKLAAGEPIVVVDLRHSLDFEADPATIPGALHLDPENFSALHDTVPRDRDVVLYCT